MANQKQTKSTRPVAQKNRATDTLPHGLKIGHAHDAIGLTGCTVFLFDKPVVASADVRGSAPATANFSSLDPLHSNCRADAVLLTGGSSFGLASAAGVQRFLEDRGQGIDVGVTYVPLVPTAGIFDLSVGDYTCRPTAQMALAACLTASGHPPEQGSVGAGMGASVGKSLGIKNAMRGGFGWSKKVSAQGAEIWAFAVVNAVGDIWLPGRNTLVAGARTSPDELKLAKAGTWMNSSGPRRAARSEGTRRTQLSAAGSAVLRDIDGQGIENTTLVVVVTNCALDKVEARKLAEAAHAGLIDVVYPVHTRYDGDLTIAVSMGVHKEDLTALSLLAQQSVGEAIVNAVSKASSVDGLPSVTDLKTAAD